MCVCVQFIIGEILFLIFISFYFFGCKESENDWNELDFSIEEEKKEIEKKKGKRPFKKENKTS